MKIAGLDEGPIWALGAMSGTSMDGVDAAVILTNGVEIFEFGPTQYRAFTDKVQTAIRAAVGQWPGDPDVAYAAEVVETEHAELLSEFEADIVGFHGQTLAHDPGGRGTHQAGDGGVLAAALGKPVVWDFRTADVALGGQGAPLAPFYHFALARLMDAAEPVAFLNLGGVANLTWVDPTASAPETPGACLAFDTGPANAPVDDLVRARFGAPFDRDGAIACSGAVNPAVVEAFLAHPFFLKMPPKSLDRNDFSGLIEDVAQLGDSDAVATLTACSVAAVVRAMEHCPKPPTILWVAGGGRKNAAMMAWLARDLPFPVMPLEEAGLDGDMLEAQAFAFLAVRVARGLPTSAPGTTGVSAAVGGGRIAYPDAG